MLYWIIFHCVVLFFLVCDITFSKKRFNPWLLIGFWILLALIFNGLVYFSSGRESGLQFLTAYLVEKSLSVDNLFVFLMLFNHFKLPLELQHKVLMWGILGAIVMRLAFILLGIQLLMAVHWMIYVLGVFLCFTGVKLFFRSQKPPELHRYGFLRFLPVAKQRGYDSFFVREDGQLKMTTLFLALITIEMTDIIFALDSIPAVLAITRDPFIAYTSNVFAILGMRSLYFALCPLLKKFSYLNWGLAAILVFVSVKMLLSGIFTIPLGVTLLIIILILLVTAVLSWKFPRKVV